MLLENSNLPVSPLTGKENTRLVESTPTRELIAAWEKTFSIDIADYFAGIESIERYQCEETKLNFFMPLDAGGSDSLYAQLGKFDWYYKPSKWEHERAILDIDNGCRVLEVGCGYGDFVERVNNQEYAAAVGIEMNQEAVKSAQSYGRPVLNTTLEEIADNQSESFDIVCHFQVLEHVTAPLIFLEKCLACLKPGGRLLLGVPNMASFIQYSKHNLLNMPPHHMTQWYPETFRALSRYLPAFIETVEFEPLADYHVDWFVNTTYSRFPNSTYIRKAIRPLKPFARNLIHKSQFMRRLIPGHSQYVALRKK